MTGPVSSDRLYWVFPPNGMAAIAGPFRSPDFADMYASQGEPSSVVLGVDVSYLSMPRMTGAVQDHQSAGETS